MLRLLLALVRRAGECADCETLLQEICGRTDADESNVRTAVRKLRLALNDERFELVATGHGGYSLAVPVSWCDELPAQAGTPPRRWNTLKVLTVSAAALLLLGLAGFASWSRRPFVSVAAPARIDRHEALIFGECRGAADDEVVLYVHPDDRRDLYWAQARPERDLAAGRWQVAARFGNEFGIDMRVPPPLGFDLVAALVPATARARFPADGGGQSPQRADSLEAFRAALLEQGARAVSRPVRVLRVPEPACLRTMVRLISPPPVAEPGTVLGPSVRLAWEPPDPRYVTLLRDGVLVPLPVPPGRVPSGSTVTLEPGLYQVKVAPEMADTMPRCEVSAWFEVR